MMAVTTSETRYSFPNGGLLPQEEMLEVGKKPKNLSIGIPLEDQNQESRVSLTPEAVEILVNNGHEIRIENNAGKASNYSNADYSEKGATIVNKKEDVFSSDILLKIAPPTLNELKLMNSQQILFSSLHLHSQNREYMQELISRKVTAIAFEKIKDENNSYPVTSSMSAIAGNTAVLIAAEYQATCAVEKV